MNTIIVAVNAGIALYSCYVKSNFQEGLQQLLMLNVRQPTFFASSFFPRSKPTFFQALPFCNKL